MISKGIGQGLGGLRAPHAIAAIETFVAGSAAYGHVAATVAEGGVPHHMGQMFVQGTRLDRRLCGFSNA